jgi:hypothetical protein
MFDISINHIIEHTMSIVKPVFLRCWGQLRSERLWLDLQFKVALDRFPSSPGASVPHLLLIYPDVFGNATKNAHSGLKKRLGR